MRLATDGPASHKVAEVGPTLRSLLKLRTQDELRPQDSHTDELGFTHTRHAQYFKGVPVEYGVYVAHARKGTIETLNGEVIKIGTALDATPTLSEKTALAKALVAVGAKIYSWQVPAAEKELQVLTSNPSASYYPKGELLISGDDKASTGAHLAYKFAVHAQQPASAHYVYVDAQSGEVFRRIPIAMDNNVPGTAATRYSGNQAITIDQVSGNSYRLREAIRGNGAACGTGSASIETYSGGGRRQL